MHSPASPLPARHGARSARAVATRAAALLPALLAIPPASAQDPVTVEVPFESHDGHALLGRLTLPAAPGRHPVVVYVQTAEGMTIEMRRPDGRGGTFDYLDLYADELPALGVGFFRYEGRGIRSGGGPPRYEVIDREAYDTSTLENKVRDVLSALATLRARPEVDAGRVLLMGASEGTLLAAEAASRSEDAVAGLVLYGCMSGTMREVFRYIMTDGGFLTYRGFFDTDRDGRITPEEFEADPRRYRARVFQGAAFAVFDPDGDGAFTAADMPLLTKVYLDAIDGEDYAVLDAWAATAAGVSTPQGWFRDHFEHEPIWTFLSRLDVPVGIFHGEQDPNTPVAGVRELEQQAEAAGKQRMEFHYFPELDHSLDVIAYFLKDELPAGHRAIFEYIARITRRER